MVIYRPHRGGLAESMAEAREFEDFEAMKRYIVEESAYYWGKPAFAISDIVIDGEQISDNRIGWKDERNVCVKRYFGEDYMEKYGCPQCIGMCATDYPGIWQSQEMCRKFLERRLSDGLD